MKYCVVAIGVAALSAVAASAQEQAPPAEAAASPWQFFKEDGGRTGASVRSADGSQLVLKCDKPGRREVHAIILSSTERLAVPNSRAVSRPITFQFDGGSPKTESWGFYTQHALAQGKTSDRALARFVTGLRGSSAVKLRLDTGIGSDVVLDFDVTGAREAVTRVYADCNDSAPA